MTVETLDKAGTLAKDTIDKIQAPAKEKAAAEASVAAEAKAKADAEKAKDEGSKLAQAEAQAKEDERILSGEEKDLSDTDKTRKTELLEIKRKQDDTPEARLKRVEEKSQMRIDEIKSELLQKEHKSNETIAKLQAELDSLKKSIQPKLEEDAQAKSKREESERLAKYIEDDKSKAREDRREMSREDLEEWYLEDPLGTTEWMQKRSVRRSEEQKALQEKQKETVNNSAAKIKADEFIKNQNDSLAALLKKYPEVVTKKVKVQDAIGKTDAEVDVLMADESEHARLAVKIVNSDVKKYLQDEKGPELVMAEMDKRLAKPEKKAITMTDEEFEEKVKAEVDRRARLDEGINSTKGKNMENSNQNKSVKTQHLERIAKKANIKMEDLDKTIKRRETIPGASTFEDKDE